jgi:hypothetical protein
VQAERALNTGKVMSDASTVTLKPFQDVLRQLEARLTQPTDAGRKPGRCSPGKKRKCNLVGTSNKKKEKLLSTGTKLRRYNSYISLIINIYTYCQHTFVLGQRTEDRNFEGMKQNRRICNFDFPPLRTAPSRPFINACFPGKPARGY